MGRQPPSCHLSSLQLTSSSLLYLYAHRSFQAGFCRRQTSMFLQVPLSLPTPSHFQSHKKSILMEIQIYSVISNFQHINSSWHLELQLIFSTSFFFNCRCPLSDLFSWYMKQKRLVHFPTVTANALFFHHWKMETPQLKTKELAVLHLVEGKWSVMSTDMNLL